MKILYDLKMNEVKEINIDEFYMLKEYFENRAYELEQFYKKLGYKRIYDGHFFHLSSVPCLYDDIDVYNPKDGSSLRVKPLPKKYKNYKKDEVAFLYHFNPGGCPNLKPFYSVVYCLVRTRDTYEIDSNSKYYISKHRVGECPFKKVGRRD